MNTLHYKWPRRRRAAEQRDELPPPQMIEPHWPVPGSRTAFILLEMASPGQRVCELGSQRAWSDESPVMAPTTDIPVGEVEPHGSL
jgi:hypothetical protein